MTSGLNTFAPICTILWTLQSTSIMVSNKKSLNELDELLCMEGGLRPGDGGAPRSLELNSVRILREATLPRQNILPAEILYQAVQELKGQLGDQEVERAA